MNSPPPWCIRYMAWRQLSAASIEAHRPTAWRRISSTVIARWARARQIVMGVMLSSFAGLSAETTSQNPASEPLSLPFPLLQVAELSGDCAASRKTGKRFYEEGQAHSWAVSGSRGSRACGIANGLSPGEASLRRSSRRRSYSAGRSFHFCEVIRSHLLAANHCRRSSHEHRVPQRTAPRALATTAGHSGRSCRGIGQASCCR